MFNPKKAARFMGKLLAIVLPILVLALALGILTELNRRGVSSTERRVAWQFWVTAARATIPTIVALLAVYLLAARFVLALYKLKNLTEARSFVHHVLFGLFKFGPWYKVAGGIAEASDDHVLKRAGGPGQLVVYNDTAVLLEQGGQFARVCAPSQKPEFPRLAPFEKIYHVIDLRPKRWVYDVSAMSSEGIPVTCQADISYQIDDEGILPTEQVPFPASDDTIFRAATCTWIREADRPEEARTMDWGGRVIVSETEGNLRTIISQYRLDRLVGLDSQEDENPREEIRRELEKRLRAAAPKLGARILSVSLGDIRVDHWITQQWIEAWQAVWESEVTKRQALGKAAQVESVERAKTDAQVVMITSVDEALRSLVTSDETITSKVVLTRLFMVVSRVEADPLARVYLPQEAVKTLKLLRDMIV
jgi:SPFH domain / Band 7 family